MDNRPRLMNYALQLTKDVTLAEDLVQSAMLRALTMQHLYHEQGKFNGWIFTLMYKMFINECRDKKMKGAVYGYDYDHLEYYGGTDEMRTGFIFEDVRNIIDKFRTQKMRDIAQMIYFDQLKYQDVAQRLNMPLGSVKSYIYRIKRLLMAQLTEYVDTAERITAENKVKKIM